MTLQNYTNSQLFNTFHEEAKWGRNWLVVKGVPIVEGVLKNYFVPATEFGAFAHDWNDVPLVLRHPSMNGGTAKTPNVDVPVIGRFYNALMDGTRLTGEFWLDKDALAESEDGQKILSAIKNNKKIEVSTGYHAQIDNIAGDYNLKHYVGIHRNLHPDHIAILPDVPGACSIADGCGLNRNDSVICNDCPCKEDATLIGVGAQYSYELPKRLPYDNKELEFIQTHPMRQNMKSMTNNDALIAVLNAAGIKQVAIINTFPKKKVKDVEDMMDETDPEDDNDNEEEVMNKKNCKKKRK